MDNTIIVLITHGKGDSDPHNIAVKLFNETDKANEYCSRVTDKDSKYWTVAEIVDDSEPIEPMRDGFVQAFSSDWL